MEWRDIPGFPGYLIGEDGTIMRTDTRQRIASSLMIKGKSYRTHVRYLFVMLRDESGRMRYLRVHRLVLLAFHGPPPSDGHEARHLDGDHFNNHRDNLVWGTRSENRRDYYQHLESTGAKHRLRRLTYDEVRAIYASEEPWEVLSERYGLSGYMIRRIRNGDKWRHVTNAPRDPFAHRKRG